MFTIELSEKIPGYIVQDILFHNRDTDSYISRLVIHFTAFKPCGQIQQLFTARSRSLIIAQFPSLF